MASIYVVIYFCQQLIKARENLSVSKNKEKEIEDI